MDELVSIIMPAYNAEAFIAEAVSSVLQQNLQNWELIVIADDGRDYQHILARYAIHDERVRFTATQKVQSGPNHARNIGLEMARGQWVAPLDADDIYYPQRLALLLQVAAETGLALDNINVSGTMDTQDGLVIKNPVIKNPVIKNPIGQTPGIKLGSTSKFGIDEFRKSLVPLLFLFHREIIPQGWDEDIVRGADTLFNLRALEIAQHAGFVEQAMHEYRIHNQSMCHAVGAENLFEQAYATTLHRLQEDGLGFKSLDFRRKVIEIVEEKRKINCDFLQAVSLGFNGNYQHFVQSLDLGF